jgi:hypothetical protein
LPDARHYPFSLNVFTCVDPEDEEQQDEIRQQVMHAFHKLWPETETGQYVNMMLRHTIRTLMENRTLTLADVEDLLTDGAFRKQATGKLGNVETRRFWERFAQLAAYEKSKQVEPLRHRVDELVTESLLKPSCAILPLP